MLPSDFNFGIKMHKYIRRYNDEVIRLSYERYKPNIKSENIYSYFIRILLDRKLLDFINFNYHERTTNERISCHSLNPL